MLIAPVREMRCGRAKAAKPKILPTQALREFAQRNGGRTVFDSYRLAQDSWAAFARGRSYDVVRGDPYAELLLAGAERTDLEWPPDRAKEWGGACMARVRKRMPDSPVVEAALHLDETRWHCHVLVMPLAVRDGRRGLRHVACGWRLGTGASANMRGAGKPAAEGAPRRRRPRQ